MQSLKTCMQRLSLTSKFPVTTQISKLDVGKIACISAQSNLHTASALNAFDKGNGPRKWPALNRKMYPVQSPDEERRLAYVCHVKTNIRYSPKKMYYIACLVRGMSVDEAIKQLNFVLKKGAAAVKETILEAQKLAVERHNVEYKSNLWVAESFVGKGVVISGIRRHAKSRVGEIRYTYCHYFVRLEEGKPPANYYLTDPKTGDEMLEDYIQKMRQRKITNSL